MRDTNQLTRTYMDSLLVELRQLDCTIPDTTFHLFGETFATPIMTAALSHLDNHHSGGMVELARGAKEANVVLWYGYGEDAELEEILATGAKTIKIIKPFKERKEIYRKIEHAKRAGVFALGMDIDHGYDKFGQYDMNALMCGITSGELKDFITNAEIPFIVKGVLSVQDALKCAEAGAAGIVVSHHHGIMDYAVPPLMVLPEIREAVGPEMKVFVDCGIGSGADAFKSIALGADAVSVGRAMLDSFRTEGAAAVRNAIVQMTRELAGYMAHTAAADLSHIDGSVVRSLDR